MCSLARRQDMRKRGESLVLYQDMSKWIVKMQLIVGSFYIRSGHNFSADCIWWADMGRIIEWSQKMGFTEYGTDRDGMN